MNKFFRIIIVFTLSIFQLFTLELQASAPRFYTSNLDHVMLNGYDVLSYYTNQRPLKGSPEYQIEYQGTKWYFVNKINMNKFKRNPEMYIPEFGGYSVWAIAHGKLIGGDPEIWKLVEGGLYLFCSERTRTKWMQERELINRLARDNWPAILD
jgi:YHS domain-containing protein